MALLLSVFLGACTCPTRAQELTTSLIDIHLGSGLSDTASALGIGGYELQDGTWVSFQSWYHTDWPDLHVQLLTQVSPDSGVLWGFSTGESGPKYRIDPGFTLGYITQTHPKPNNTVSLSVTTNLGGSLTELPCEADYGELGTYTANCRLAASELSPKDSLKYLVKADPARLHLSLSFRASF